MALSNASARWRRIANWFWTVALAVLLEVVGADIAAASTVLVSDTSLVNVSQSSVYAFEAPGPGTITTQLMNIDWPTNLSSLTLTTTTANDVLQQLAATGTQAGSFKVQGGISYFAHVDAIAGGPLHLGLYSLQMTFTPASSPVPLPSGVWMFLAAILLVAILLMRRPDGRDSPYSPRDAAKAHA